MSIGAGQKIGNYKVLSQLGVGGMGSVYLAEHPLIGKKVALKVIHAELAHNKEVIARFFNEARAVNKIGNEHIVEIHDFGQTAAGEHFFIMEYLEGHTLADALAKERVLAVPRALHIAAQIANGLAAAHTCGIIHRDLKPDNIMLLARLGEHDFVKVLDFGLAKMIHDEAGQKLTAVGVVLGTPQYMSPEACESKPNIDHRSDIYCLGILLFQMVCGRVPFEGETMGEILVKHVSQPPPAPRGLNPTIPPSVEQIILRCLAKAPDARFGTMKELREALLNAEGYLASSPPVMPSAAVSDANAQTILPGQMQAGGAGGVDGFGPTAAHQAAPAGPGPGDGRNFPLQPPPPSLAGVAPASAKTAFINGPPGGNGAAAPAAPGTAPASAKTAFIDGPPPQTGAVGAAAKTAFLDGGAMPTAGAPEMPKRSSTAVPEMAPPMPTSNETMIIGTPEGYSDKPPTKTWPIVVALLSVLLVVGGGVAALVWPGFLNEDENEAVAAAPDQTGGAAKSDGTADHDTKPDETDKPDESDKPPEPAKPEMVVISFTTVPDGAEMFEHGKSLGKTPKDLEFEKDSKHEIEFRHPLARTRKKRLVADDDRKIKLELKRKRGGSHGGSSHKGGSKGGKGGKGSKGGKGGKGGKGSVGAGDTVKPDFGP